MTPWGALDDGFHSHPKVIVAGLAGAGLYARALSYCACYLTDGHVPREWVRMALDGEDVNLDQHLEDVGLWRKQKDGYRIADYLDYNPSRAQVEERRRKRSEAARRAAEARQPDYEP